MDRLSKDLIFFLAQKLSAKDIENLCLVLERFNIVKNTPLFLSKKYGGCVDLAYINLKEREEREREEGRERYWFGIDFSSLYPALL